MGRRRRRKPSPISNSFVVAAVDSRDRVSADYVCNGVADEVDINAALAALGIAEGVVVLMEGTFTLAASIAFTANNQTLRGQGRATYIDATALGAGVHGIVLTGFTDCHIEDLAIETNAGGGNVTHCIFIEDGAHDFHVRNVTIVNSDDDGIHVEGTTINLGHIHLCHVEAADGDGIEVVMDAANFANRFHVQDCDILNCGGAGITFAATTGGNFYCQIINNILYNCAGDAIAVFDGDHTMIRGNITSGNTGDGIYLEDTNYGQILGNVCEGNGIGGIHLSASTETTITGNTCQGNTGRGIEVSATSPRNTLSGNVCEGNGTSGIRVSVGCDHCAIVGNECGGNTSYGIEGANAGSITISGNICRGNTLSGIIVTTADHSIISGNVCTQNGEWGINFGTSDWCLIVGNVCDENDLENTGSFDGIRVILAEHNLFMGNQCTRNDRWGIWIDNQSNYNKVSNNYTDGNTAGSITVNAATCNNNQIEFNTVEEGAPVDAGTATRAYGNYDPSADLFAAVIGLDPW